MARYFCSVLLPSSVLHIPLGKLFLTALCITLNKAIFFFYEAPMKLLLAHDLCAALCQGFFRRSCLFPFSSHGLVISSRWLWSGVSAAAPFTPLAVRQYSLSDLIFFLW